MPVTEKGITPMLLNRHNLSLTALCSKDPACVNLNGLHITPTHTEATDGHCAGRVTLPVCDTEDFPPCGGVVSSSEQLKPCLVPREAIERLAKSIPTKAAARMPVLGHVRVDVVATNANNHFRAVTTDMQTVTPIEAQKAEGTFPDMEQVFPTDTPYITVGFNAELMAKVLKVAGAFNGRNHAVKLDIFLTAKEKEAGDGLSQSIPMRLTATDVETGQTGTFLVMPMRL